MNEDTIAAISTGGTNSGINIIRISGEESYNVISKIFTNHAKVEHGKIVHGYIVNPVSNEKIDEVLVSYFKAPKSYTGEDVCEINSHGGRVVTQQILNLLLTEGVRLAQAGEFSKRAFVNGKMDLSKAEAIIDMINAETKAQAKIALQNISGQIEEKIRYIKNEIVELVAQAEVNIDYPEYDYDELTNNELHKKISCVARKVNDIIETHEHSKYVKNGVNVAILGATNAGKSSLLNCLTNSNRAIVTDIEGTTRDIVSERIMLKNIVVNLFDTAGLRETSDKIEKIGIEKSIQLIEQADFVIYLLDATKTLSTKDIDTISTLVANKKQHIECLNKLDLALSHEKMLLIKDIKKLDENGKIIEISTKTEMGIKELCEYMSDLFNQGIDNSENKIVVNERHNEILKNVKNNLRQALEDVKDSKPLDIICMSLNEAIYNLGAITGESASEDVIRKIFERFCLGK